MTEAYTSLENIQKYYGKLNNNVWTKGAQIPFNFDFITNTDFGSTAKDFKKYIDSWVTGMTNIQKQANEKLHANWVVSIFQLFYFLSLSITRFEEGIIYFMKRQEKV